MCVVYACRAHENERISRIGEKSKPNQGRVYTALNKKNKLFPAERSAVDRAVTVTMRAYTLRCARSRVCM